MANVVWVIERRSSRGGRNWYFYDATSSRSRANIWCRQCAAEDDSGEYRVVEYVPRSGK